ncbi:hypothetical protein [Rufibacter sp. LB8]|uniref:hypothetical protein n=1 Tax=Rufibacter sp. LB8 TaxID=2777781 RepID=UPI00178C42CF|nr:hypothetical protein [Rufibacter sp. LB8]
MKPIYSKQEFESQIKECQEFDHLHKLIQFILSEERHNYSPEDFIDLLLQLIKKHSEVNSEVVYDSTHDEVLKELTECLIESSFWKCRLCGFQNPMKLHKCIKCRADVYCN